MFGKSSFTGAFRSKHESIPRLLFNIRIKNIKVGFIDFNKFSSFVEDMSSISLKGIVTGMLAVLIENQIVDSE
jgi:hypothetical protein